MAQTLRLKTTIPPGSADDPDLCWMFKTTPSVPYGVVLDPSTRKQIGAHRASYIAAHGPIPPGALVRHACDTPGCVRPGHLVLGTHQDNSDDCSSRHRQNQPKGAAQGLAKLTDEKVLEIRRLYDAGGESYSTLGPRFGVHPQTIAKVVRRQTWTHV